MKNDNRIYVLIRGDLSKSQQAVQAGHALLELARGQKIGAGETLVYLRVQDENELLGWAERLAWGYLFREPDIGDAATAYATFKYDPGFDDLRLI